MSDTEDFLAQINVEELFPDEETAEESPKRKRRKLSRKKKKKEKKMKKLMPNYFIGFQIYDAIIRQRIADFQNKIIEANPLLKKALIDIRTLHITLAVTHLENKERVSELQEKLEDWGENDMKSHFTQPINLTFKGIGTFRSGVTFVKINECDNHKRLCDLALAVNDFLSKSGFQAEKSKTFTPHLTLLKLSKNYKLFKDKKKFYEDLQTFGECEDEFGSQVIKAIQLLSMLEKKDDDGYYKCVWQRETGEFPET